MTLIHHPVEHPKKSGKRVELKADRLTLAKRRWHGVAEDGAEFNFDLEHHLHDRDIILENESAHYVLMQTPEPVLEIALGEKLDAARIAWSLGNLHFPIELDAQAIRVTDDPAVRLFLERDQIAFTATSKVFHPLKAASGHSHGHGHHHH